MPRKLRPRGVRDRALLARPPSTFTPSTPSAKDKAELRLLLLFASSLSPPFGRLLPSTTHCLNMADIQLSTGELLSALKRWRRRLRGKERETLTGHIHYFSKRKELMCYARMVKRNLPIGSGIVEGACKSVIGARAKRSGQRWRQPGLTGVLNLRCIHQSERFNPFWQRLADTYSTARVYNT